MAHPNRKRVVEDWAKIKARLADGVPFTRIGRDYQVPAGVVRLLAETDGVVRERPVREIVPGIRAIGRAELYPKVIALREEQKTFAEIAAILGVGPWVARHSLIAAGRRDLLRGNQGRKPNLARRAEAVALREQGLTLEEIGQRMGFTRERARQLIKRAGRNDLNYEFTKKMGLTLGPRVEWACIVCGKSDKRRPSDAALRRFCSSACAGKHKELIADRAPTIIAMRRAGRTWEEVGREFGVPFPGLHRALKRYAAQTGLDVSGVFNRWNGTRNNRRVYRHDPAERLVPRYGTT